MIKKADILLGLVLLVFCTVASLFFAGTGTAGTTVVVKIDDQLYGTYELSTDQIVSIDQNDHHNVLVIRHGSVSMTESDCKNQICVDQGAIQNEKQVIVCLPNHVIVSIQTDNDNGVDSVSY